jgi:histidinol-phosphatase (PHP family)
MYLTDYHTHSLCSPDSTAPLEEMVTAALNAGLAQLCVTDHFDQLDIDGNPIRFLDWTPILTQYNRVRAALGQRLDLRLGLELGGAPFNPETAAAVLCQAPLDFVIGSIHNLSPAAGGRDFYFLEYRTREECFAALDDYFSSLLGLSGMDCYDALGHIIYPLRYMNARAGHHITLDAYAQRIDALLQRVIQTGHAIEINTHCGGEVTDWLPILRRYRALGGELITTGSDAHRPGDVGKGLVEAVALLKETGFRYLTVYRARKPEQIKL